MALTIHPDVVEAMDQIDAAVFTGDCFIDGENRKHFELMMARWRRGCKAHADTEAYVLANPDTEDA